MSEGRKAGLFLIFVTVFIDLLGFGIVLPLLPRYAEHFEASGGTLGLLMASFSAMQFIFAPIWGRISDRVGRRPILILGLVGSTVFYGMFGFATSLGKEGVFLGIGALSWLFITRIGAGIAGATIPTAQAYIADITGPKERGKGMALIGAAFGIGFTFGPLIGAAFVSAETGATPSAAPGYVACVLSGMAALLSIFKLPESLNKQTSKSLAKRHHWFDVSSFRHALSRPRIGLILLTSFLTTFAFAQFESTLSLLTQELGFAARSNFFIFAYIGFILTLSQGFLVRRLIPKVGEYRMGLAGIILMVIGLLLIGVAGNSGSYILLYAVLPISVVGFSATTPSLQSLLSLNTSEDQQGGVLGIGQSISALARILGPLAGIVLFKGTQNGAIQGSITSPYWVGAGIMLLGLLLMSSLKSTAGNSDVQSTVET
ncbi:MFS transporter [uncultured Gimesia sp.]|mgnify:CR=1 FL=1|uniref:MFS transporter n=1 Tax=uncultured Gimesia sp. TaxID=1678688 RepID=UPI0030DC14EA